MIAVLGLSRCSSISETTRSLAAKIRSSTFNKPIVEFKMPVMIEDMV